MDQEQPGSGEAGAPKDGKRATRGRRRKEGEMSAQEAAQPENRQASSETEGEPSAQAEQADVQQRFIEAYRNYVQALQEAWAPQAVQQRAAEAYGSYVQTLQEMTKPERVQQRAAEAYHNYAQAVQAQGAPEEVQQRAAEAYRSYVQTLQETSQAYVQPRAAEAYRAYVRGVGQALAPVEVQQRAAEAYRTYVQAVQDAWAQVDVNRVDLGSIALIGQSMLAAASMTTAVGAALRQRWMAAAAMEAAGLASQ